MAIDLIEPLWPLSVCVQAPVATSQILMDSSPNPDASQRLSGEMAIDWIESLWPSSVCRQAF
jgi:hypothetical protein